MFLVYLNNPFAYSAFCLLCKKVYFSSFWNVLLLFFMLITFISSTYLFQTCYWLSSSPYHLLCEESWECRLHGRQAYLRDLFIAVSSILRIVHHSKLPINGYYLNEWVNELHLSSIMFSRSSDELRSHRYLVYDTTRISTLAVWIYTLSIYSLHITTSLTVTTLYYLPFMRLR